MPAAAFEVRLTRGAEDDLTAIYGYLSHHRSAEEAEALLDIVLARISSLERFPERGGIPRELAALGIKEFRRIIASPYRLIYRIIDTVVHVSVIVDGRRDIQALLARRLLR